MSDYVELTDRLEAVEAYIVGSNEWQRAMEASAIAARAWLSISSYDYVESILKFMEEEVKTFKEQVEEGMFDGYGYQEQINFNLASRRGGRL